MKVRANTVRICSRVAPQRHLTLTSSSMEEVAAKPPEEVRAQTAKTMPLEAPLQPFAGLTSSVSAAR